MRVYIFVYVNEEIGKIFIKMLIIVVFEVMSRLGEGKWELYVLFYSFMYSYI